MSTPGDPDGAAIDARFATYRRTGDLDLRNELVTEHHKLARAFARRYQGRGVALEDLEQVAALALVRAVERFEPDRGVRFSTFAGRTIDGELKRHFRDRAWSVRVPRGSQELGIAARGAVDELTQQLGRGPTTAELAERIGAEPDEVLQALDASAAFRAGSLDRPAGPEGQTLLERMGSLDEGLEAAEGRAAVRQLLQELPERERRIVEMRFYEDRSQREIASILGISQMHVSRLFRRALADLRAVLDDA